MLRLVVGLVFIAHGAQKLFGIWGGGGLPGTAAGFAQLGLEPAYPLALIAGVVEFGGGLLLLLGAFTLIAAILLTVQMLVAIWTVHLANGFFLAPTATSSTSCSIGALVCLMLTGAGALSVESPPRLARGGGRRRPGPRALRQGLKRSQWRSRARAALITGGKRIGAAVAVDLAARGADVAIAYNRSQDEAEATAARARESGRLGVAIQADLVGRGAVSAARG